MRYKLLGHSGLRVSELCLGAMTFGSEDKWCANPQESRAIFDTFVEQGGNFFDTASLYTYGDSEKLLGEFVNTDRERFVVATKYTSAFPGRNDPNAAGNHRKNLVQTLDASLKRMNLDYIDFYWIHCWDFTTPVEEVMRALDDAVRAGKILHIGISNAPAWLVSRANTMAEMRGWTRFSALQLEYSLAERTIELELLPMSKALGMDVLAWSPLAGGMLSGKYSRPDNKEPKRQDSAGFYRKDDRRLAVAQVIDQVADDLGASSAQVALAWVRSRGVIPIVGARTKTQIEENLKCLELELKPEHLEKLNEVSRVYRGHPYGVFKREIVRQITFGGMINEIDDHPLVNNTLF